MEVGDTIRCHDKDDLYQVRHELEADGIFTTTSGLILTIKEIRENG